VTSVLVGVDGSEGARRAAEFGRNIARAFRARLTFLHVIEKLPTGALARPEAPDGAWYGKQMQNAQQLLVALSEELQTPDVEQAVEMGHPVDVICREAEERDVDLIVLGRHGHRPGPRLMLGSVGAHVAAAANRSVTIVR
jgi:nucleotide-binding universal stress UspA family protein